MQMQESHQNEQAKTGSVKVSTSYNDPKLAKEALDKHKQPPGGIQDT